MICIVSVARLRSHAVGDVTVLTLSGPLDESFDPAAFGDACGRITLVDLDDVRSVTSFGVKQWLTAMRRIPSDTYVGFVNARPTVAMQFNLVVGFAGEGELLSLYAPFMCPSSGDEHHHLVDVRRDYAAIASGSVPTYECHAGEAAEFDDIPETYFAFVVSRSPPSPPPAVQQMLDGAPASKTKTPFTAHKEVFADVTAFRLHGSLDGRARLKRVLDGVDGDVLFLLDELEELDAEGLKQLAPLLASPRVQVAFARVPHRHLEVLRTTFPSATLLSAMLDVADEERERVQLEIRAQDAAALEAGTLTSPASGLRITAEDQRLGAAIAKHLRAPSDAFEAYLERRAVTPVSRTRMEAARASVSSSLQSVARGYEILDLVGSGGMADIFLAVQQGDQGFRKKVILKKIRSSLALNAEYLEMFLQEARIAARLVHPNIAQILDLGQRGDEYFIALEYVEGADLRKTLAALPSLGEEMPLDIACLVGTSLAAALSCAHEARDDQDRPLNIVHCDVSPKNILLSKDGIAKLTDFGVASTARSLVKSRPGFIKGTTSYMAPEQVLGEDPLEGLADIFAAGIVLYECIAGVHPFRRGSETETFAAILAEEPPPPGKLRHDVPPELDAIVMQALEKDRRRRFASARELGRALESAVPLVGSPATPSRLAEWVSSVLLRARVNENGPMSRSGSASRERSAQTHPDAETKMLSGNNTETAPSAGVDGVKRA